jgi:hypothetical protein
MRFPPNQLLLYKLFISYPERSFYMQEIGRILGKKPGVFQRTLYNLESDGFVQSEFKANARFFFLNKKYAVLKEIQSIIKKTTEEVNIFKDTIKSLDAKRRKPTRNAGPGRSIKRKPRRSPPREIPVSAAPPPKVSRGASLKKDKGSQLELF